MERDDIIEYSLDAHHSEEQGVILRKKIWKVTALLTAITVVEVMLGAFIKQHDAIWPLVKYSFIVMTLVKAAYIVLSFMHLGDERKALKYVILVPYIIFIIYLIFICLTESTYVRSIWESHAN
ncbi:MAG: cytochrome C oxidase subunit IV family protein [Flavobacteriia bacterium]|nr:cytochrome C oxidase subunit IV family protein [Flavobacteriia bacterium]